MEMNTMETTFTITEPETLGTINKNVNFTRMIELKTKAHLVKDKKDYGCWSMREIVDELQYIYGSNAGEICRAYILKTRLNLEDFSQEEAYINRNVFKARQQAKNDKFFKGKKAIKGTNNMEESK